MHVVCDMLRGPVFSAGLMALAREGVNVSAGWQLDKRVGYDSAALSVKQVTLDHTHYDTIQGCNACTELYGSVFRPTVHQEIYPFEDLPRATCGRCIRTCRPEFPSSASPRRCRRPCRSCSVGPVLGSHEGTGR